MYWRRELLLLDGLNGLLDDRLLLRSDGKNRSDGVRSVESDRRRSSWSGLRSGFRSGGSQERKIDLEKGKRERKRGKISERNTTRPKINRKKTKRSQGLRQRRPRRPHRPNRPNLQLRRRCTTDEKVDQRPSARRRRVSPSRLRRLKHPRQPPSSTRKPSGFEHRRRGPFGVVTKSIGKEVKPTWFADASKKGLRGSREVRCLELDESYPVDHLEEED